MTTQNLRQRMIANAKSYNKTLTDEYLNKKTDRELARFTHPLERGDFRREILKIEMEDNNE